jgi:hypothetical protein
MVLRKKKVLFFGEMPSSSVTGISLSNKINLDILTQSGFEVLVVEEKTDHRQHEKRGLVKIMTVLSNYLRFLKIFTKKT